MNKISILLGILLFIIPIYNNVIYWFLKDDCKIDLCSRYVNYDDLYNAYDSSYTNMYIEIDQLDISAPVIINVSTSDDSEYNDVLTKGVAHAKGSKVPGEEGVSVIFGHSSLDTYSHYAQIFKDVYKLKIGDTVKLYNNMNEYVYEVYKISIVGNDYIDLGKYESTEKELFMITCYPTGTSKNRILVQAKEQTYGLF